MLKYSATTPEIHDCGIPTFPYPNLYQLARRFPRSDIDRYHTYHKCERMSVSQVLT